MQRLDLLFRAEHSPTIQNFAISRPGLLKSQCYAARCMRDYLLQDELGGYSFYLTGNKGCGKTFTVLSTLRCIKQKRSTTKIAFLTADPYSQTIAVHPSFYQDIDGADIVILNDFHYFLQALAEGLIDKERGAAILAKIFTRVLDKKIKSIIITDSAINDYLERIDNKTLTDTIGNAYFASAHELITGQYHDLKAVASANKLSIDDMILWNVSYTKPNIRYMLAINAFYRNCVHNFREFVSKVKQEAEYDKVIRTLQRYLPRINVLAVIGLLYENPIISSHVQAEIVERKLADLNCKPLVREKRYLRDMPPIERINNILSTKIGLAYVPNCPATTIQRSHFYEWTGCKLDYNPEYHQISDMTTAFSAADSSNGRSGTFGGVSFVLGDPLNLVLFQKLFDHGIHL